MSQDDSNVTVKGSIDAGFTSYWGDSDKHGKTVDATEKGNSGRETANLIPEEADPEDLNETQGRVIECAVLHPEYSSGQVAESVSVEVSGSSVRRILADKVPEWYEENFVNRGKSVDPIAPSDRKKPTITDMTVEEALEELEGQGTAEEVGEVMNQSKHTVMDKLNDAVGDTVNSHRAVEGYHNRTKVFTLSGFTVVPKDAIEDVRAEAQEPDEDDETTDLAELFDTTDDTEETDETEGDLGDLLGEEVTEETTEEPQDEGGFEKWEKGVGAVQETEETEEEGDEWDMEQDIKELERELAHKEIRTVCEYEAQGDGAAAKLAEYVLERL